MNEILFSSDPADGAPTLQLMLTTRSEFKMLRKSDRECLLTIQGAKLGGPHLALPQYPPQDFDGLTHVAAQQIAAAVEITIGIERGGKLTAFTKDKSVWVKSGR